MSSHGLGRNGRNEFAISQPLFRSSSRNTTLPHAMTVSIHLLFDVHGGRASSRRRARPRRVWPRLYSTHHTAGQMLSKYGATRPRDCSIFDAHRHHPTSPRHCQLLEVLTSFDTLACVVHWRRQNVEVGQPPSQVKVATGGCMAASSSSSSPYFTSTHAYSMADKLHEGQDVSWKWGATGVAKGTVAEIVEEGKAQVTSDKGKTVSRNARPGDPAVKIARDGNDVVKLAHELNEVKETSEEDEEDAA